MSLPSDLKFQIIGLGLSNQPGDPRSWMGGMSIPSDWKFLESGGFVLPHQIGSNPEVGTVSPPSD